jgi:hypothetical protein
VDVEDLLREALIGVQRRIEEDERQGGADGDDGGQRESAQTLAVSGGND